jgi:hypothetical protein
LLVLGAGKFRLASEAGRQGPGAGFEVSALPLAMAVLEVFEDMAGAVAVVIVVVIAYVCRSLSLCVCVDGRPKGGQG